jgi:hypothetical protein
MLKNHSNFAFDYPLFNRLQPKFGAHSPLTFFENSFHTASAEGRLLHQLFERLLWRKLTLKSLLSAAATDL